MKHILWITGEIVPADVISFLISVKLLVAEHPLSKLTITLTLSPSTKLFTENVFDTDAGCLIVGPTKNVYVAEAIFVASKITSSPSQNVPFVAFEIRLIPTAPIVVTVMELVADSQARGSRVTEF